MPVTVCMVRGHILEVTFDDAPSLGLSPFHNGLPKSVLLIEIGFLHGSIEFFYG